VQIPRFVRGNLCTCKITYDSQTACVHHAVALRAPCYLSASVSPRLPWETSYRHFSRRHLTRVSNFAMKLKVKEDKTGNARITRHWGAFVQPLLLWKSN